MSYKISVAKANAYVVLTYSHTLSISKANLYAVIGAPSIINISKANLYAVIGAPATINISKANLYAITNIPGGINISKANIYAVVGLPGSINITKANLYAVVAQIRGTYPPSTFEIEGEFPFPNCINDTNYIERISSYDINQIPNENVFKSGRYVTKRPNFIDPIYNIHIVISDLRKSQFDDIEEFYELKNTSKYFYLLLQDNYYAVRFVTYKVSRSDLFQRYNIDFTVTGKKQSPPI